MSKKLTDEERQRWAGVPFRHRYSEWTQAPKNLLSEIHRLDPLLDFKFYLPTQQWHLVRYPHGRSQKFVKVWALEENPEKGLHGYFGSWIIDALQAGDMQKRDVIAELDKVNEEVEKDKKRVLADASYEMAKDLWLPMLNLMDYGPAHNMRRFF